MRMRLSVLTGALAPLQAAALVTRTMLPMA
jgi:hypothetical protein